MTALSPRDHRFAIIGTVRADLQRLLSIARHQTARDFLNQAGHELDSAAALLDRLDVVDRTDLLEIVDVLLQLVASRLQVATRALQHQGPNAILPRSDVHSRPGPTS